MCQVKLLLSVLVISFMSSTSLGGSIVSGVSSVVGNLTNGIAHAKCERKPTGLLCQTIINGHHDIQRNLPAIANLRHCNVLLATPHCCGQLCKPASNGTCDLTSGACYCDRDPAGQPNVCATLVNEDSSDLNSNDIDVLNMCQDKCKNNTNGCKKAAASTDGLTGIVCVCYCDTASDTAAPTTT